MISTCTPYTNIPHTSALLKDYLYHFDRLQDFYAGSPHDPDTFRSIADKLQNFKFNRSAICDILERQNRALGCPEPTLKNIQSLRADGTLAIVTGQQVGLFSGPAFTLYKALTTVKLAQHLSEQGTPCVPVFWLATEDHDLEEVSATSSLDDEYNLHTLKDPGERPSRRSPVGVVEHTDQVSAALDQLESMLPPGEIRDGLLRDLRDCYARGKKWGESFARFLTRLFGRWGVILLDPLDESVHQLTRGVVSKAIEEADSLRAGLSQTSEELVKRGYHAQVHIADDSTLVFVLNQGDRVTLDKKNGKFFLDGREEISAQDLNSRLTDHPLDFSPNVLLRPIVQDTLLPTLAYVAGPSELAYWGQSGSLYKAFNRPQPVVFPRAAFTLIDSRSERLMDKYKVDLEDVWQGEQALGQKIAGAGFAEGWSERFDQSEHDLEQVLSRLQSDIEKLDPTLLDTLEHTKEKVKYQLERLRSKLTRAALNRSDVLLRHVQALSRFLLPGRELQERQVGGVYFLGRGGYELLEHLLAQVQVNCSDHQTFKF